MTYAKKVVSKTSSDWLCNQWFQDIWNFLQKVFKVNRTVWSDYATLTQHKYKNTGKNMLEITLSYLIMQHCLSTKKTGTNTYIWTSNVNIWKNELFDLVMHDHLNTNTKLQEQIYIWKNGLFDLIMQDHLSTKVVSLQNYSLWQFSTSVTEDQKHAFHKTKPDSFDWVFFQNLCVILRLFWGMRIFL